MEVPIHEIINGCVQNDRKFQKILFEMMAKKLLSVARQYCPNQYDPLDILQDSFVRIFKYIQTYDLTQGSFEAWSRKIVINTALSKLNRKNIESVMINIDEHDIPEKESMFDNDNVNQLMEIIENLPDGYKQIFCLYEIEGYSHKEIALMLNIKETTSRSQLNRSKTQIKELIKKMDNNPYFKMQID